ncbi:MAG: 1,4-dihydroxy-6-naphthoate synthase [Pirellulaceae bacterium]
MPPIHLGISTCPNDTFAFHALLNRRVDWRGLDFHVELLDVQELNERLARGEFDVAKASFFAALRMTDRLGVFRSGSALGYSVGPLLLAAANTGPPSDAWRDAQGTMREPRVLCPGEATTAHLLYRLFHGQGQVEYAVFSDIMPSLQAGTADYGVCIHEGRFTWQEQGLHRVEDLGERWEQATNSPLPLGGILGRLSLDRDTLDRVQQVIHESVRYGLDHRDETLPTMRHYAQEFNDDVLFAHVDLYVNDWTVDLGESGERALAELRARAITVGLVPETSPALQLLGQAAS